MSKTQGPRVPSGNDGGVPFYVVDDIKSGKNGTVSIGLVEVGGRLRVFAPEGFSGPPVDFIRETSTKWTCTHRQQRIFRNEVKESRTCTHAIRGAGTRIQSLIEHCKSGRPCPSLSQPHWKKHSGAPKSGGILSAFAKRLKPSDSNQGTASESICMPAAAPKPAQTPSSKPSSTVITDRSESVQTPCQSLEGNLEERLGRMLIEFMSSDLSPEKMSSHPIVETLARINNSPTKTAGEGVQSLVQIVSSGVVTCQGLTHLDFQNINYGVAYNPMTSYPLSLHSMHQSTKFKGIAIPPCSVSISALPGGGFALVFRSSSCEASFARPNGQVPQGPVSGYLQCSFCHNLLFNPALKSALARSARQNYTGIPDIYCPQSEIMRRKNNLRDERDNLRLQSLNDKRKITRSTRKLGDYQRMVVATTQMDIPNLRRLLASHLRRGRAIGPFLDKMVRASTFVEAGNNVFRRGLIPRHRRNKDGDFDEDYMRAIDRAFLVLKLGGRRVTKLTNVNDGGLSVRHTHRLMSSGM